MLQVVQHATVVLLRLTLAAAAAAAIAAANICLHIRVCVLLQVVAANKLDASSGSPISIIAGKVEEVDSIGQQQVRRATHALGGVGWLERRTSQTRL